MKTLFIVALPALAATSTIAQLDMTTYSPGYYEPLQQWQVQMNPCREFLLQQCSPVVLLFLRSQASICQAMRQQCCQQLAQISEQSQCQAICSVAQAITQQQQQWQQSFYAPQLQAQFQVMRMMVLQTLPVMCCVYIPVHYSTAATAPCSITVAATCAGGACYRRTEESKFFVSG